MGLTYLILSYVFHLPGIEVIFKLCRKIKNVEMEIKKVQIINLPKFLDSRGNLSFVEEYNHIPFKIKRTYWIYDVPGGEARGGHAYKENQEFVIALSGSFDLVIDDGLGKKTFSLNRSYYGLYIPKGVWREMKNFSTNSLALVLASESYDERDYIRNYQDFLNNIMHEKF